MGNQDILTPTQQEQFQNMIANIESRLEAVRSLNLSDNNKNKIWNILQSKKSEVQSVLTPDQQQKVQTLRQKC
ncbi:hypothetical protein RintRC_6857 [Richelia intracellularis]|nr:hypothetical protein RintRC_6857 [Richelia intracellularis]